MKEASSSSASMAGLAEGIEAGTGGGFDWKEGDGISRLYEADRMLVYRFLLHGDDDMKTAVE